MAITSVKDPITGKTIEIVEGVVQFVKITDIPKDKYGNDKRVSILIDENGQWISWGAVKSEKNRVPNAVNAKDVDGQWHDIAKGFKIRVPVERNGDFLNPIKSSLVVLETTPVQTTPPAQQTSGNQAAGKPYQKKDEVAKQHRVTFGNSVNIAELILGNTVKDELIFKKALEIYPYAVEVREYVFGKYLSPTRDNFDLGPKCGDALKHAASRSTDIKVIAEHAKRWVDMQIMYEEKALVSSSNQSSPTSTTNVVGNKESGSQSDTGGFNYTNNDDFPF